MRFGYIRMPHRSGQTEDKVQEATMKTSKLSLLMAGGVLGGLLDFRRDRVRYGFGLFPNRQDIGL